MITKLELDKLVEKYETADFIKDDPIQFLHKGNSREEIELYGFISSIFAYGNRIAFIKKLDELYKLTDYKIFDYIKAGDFSNLKNLQYRFYKNEDILELLKILSILYNENENLKSLFKYAFENTKEINLDFFKIIIDYFYSRTSLKSSRGFNHMFPNPENGGAMKRMNMFLRWMVRKSPVDLGIWDFIKPHNLLIPLDVHVARVSRNMGLLTRKSNDFKAVLELTNNLKKYCENDPIKYDFAIFSFGVKSNK